MVTKPKKEKKLEFLSHIGERILVETIVIGNQAKFVVYDNGGINYHDTFDIDGKTYHPINIQSPFIKSKLTILPNGIYEIGDNNSAKYISILLNRIQSFIHKYLEVSEFFEIMFVYYILMTWIYEIFNEIPYLRVIGDLGSGKSRFIDIASQLCYKPMIISGATTSAPIFRIIDKIKGTLIVDEADLKSSDTTSDIIKILNTGNKKGGGIVRCKANNYDELQAFDPFCPKIISSRLDFEDTALESRCISEIMQECNRDDIPLNLDHKFFDEASEIRNMLLRFRFENFFKIKQENIKIDGISSRLNQLSGPIYTLIKYFHTGEDGNNNIEEKFKQGLNIYHEILTHDRSLSHEGEIVKILSENYKDFCISPTVKRITDDVNGDRKYSLTPKRVGALLKSMRIETKKTSSGYVINLEQNKEQIEKLKKRYGFS